MSDIFCGRPLYSWGEQRQLIDRMEREETDLTLAGQQIIWAGIVRYQAFYLADWMVSSGYEFVGEWEGGVGGENMFATLPCDASKWDQWIEELLMIPPPDVPDKFRKETIKEMVRRKYMKIPLNSGLPLYYWLLEGNKLGDFCELYSCIEYLRDYFYTDDLWSSLQARQCLDNHMDETIRAGSAVYMVRVVSEDYPEVTQQYIRKVLVRLLENMYRKYRDRNLRVSATKIQCAFRVYLSTKRANILRSHPDNLFSQYSQLRKRKLEIDDSRFGAVLQ